jgi:hypothetical protein
MIANRIVRFVYSRQIFSVRIVTTNHGRFVEGKRTLTPTFPGVFTRAFLYPWRSYGALGQPPNRSTLLRARTPGENTRSPPASATLHCQKSSFI